MSDGESGPATRAVITFPAGPRRGAHSPAILAFDDLMRRFFLAKAAETVMLDDGVGRHEKAEDLLRQIMMTPAPEPRHLRFKMRLYGEEMRRASDDGLARNTDMMALFSAIQADVLRFLDDAGED